MSAYYNELDPLKAEVLREAIRAGAIALGEVDERSIADVEPGDLVGFTQCHFFAGGGFWSLALRLAGWSDDREVWTGSTPCPSFSAAGKGRGFDDARHLWPYLYPLIGKRRPRTVFGEQVAAAIGHGWIDLVCADMEAEGYAIATAVLGAHSVGAPHIRQRLYFVADAESAGSPRRGSGPVQPQPSSRSKSGECADTAEQGWLRRGPSGAGLDDQAPERGSGIAEPERPRHAGFNSNSLRARLEGHAGDEREWRGPGWLNPQQARSIAATGATRGFWRDCDWWYGRDGKYRPIGPGLQPLAHGSPARVGRLRMYGDAIVVTQAQAFIKSYLEVIA